MPPLCKDGRRKFDKKINRLVRHYTITKVLPGTTNDLSKRGVGEEDPVLFFGFFRNVLKNTNERFLRRFGECHFLKTMHDALIGFDQVVKARVVCRGDNLYLISRSE